MRLTSSASCSARRPALARATPADLDVGFGEADVTPDARARSRSTWPASARTARPRRSTTRSWPAPSSCGTTATQDRPRRRSMSSASSIPNVERVREQLPGFDYVLVSSTHNHEGPDTLGLWGPNPFQSGVDPDYLKQVEDGIVDGGQGGGRGRASRSTAQIGTRPRPGAAARRPRADRQARRAGRPPASATATTKPARRRRAVELPPRDARQQEHRDQRRLRRLHGQAPARQAQLPGRLPDRHRRRADDLAARRRSRTTTGKELEDGTFEKTERYGALVGELAEKALADGEAGDADAVRGRARERCSCRWTTSSTGSAGSSACSTATVYLWDGDPTRRRQFAPTKDVDEAASR